MNVKFSTKFVAASAAAVMALSLAGCSGGMYDNIAEAAAILDGQSIGDGYFSLSIYPPSIPINLELMKNGIQQTLLEAGALFKPCFCGPCFGAGDVPGNDALSIRHTTRNFPNREGSKPASGQLSGVMLMDARSIAATARNHGVLTAATEIDYTMPAPHTEAFDGGVYQKRCYFGFGKADPNAELRFGPNITEWPKIPALPENLLMELACVIHDPVTTTDELIPSGETSSYRSNPLGLAEFTLSRKDPGYVGRAKAAHSAAPTDAVLGAVAAISAERGEAVPEKLSSGSAVYAVKPGDGSAREQAASCQRVLGGNCNIAREYATKRYRSNLINWGMLPFLYDGDGESSFALGDLLYVPNIREIVSAGTPEFDAYVISADGAYKKITLGLAPLTDDEKKIILCGCLINFYRAGL